MSVCFASSLLFLRRRLARPSLFVFHSLPSFLFFVLIFVFLFSLAAVSSFAREEFKCIFIQLYLILARSVLPDSFLVASSTFAISPSTSDEKWSCPSTISSPLIDLDEMDQH